MARLVAVLATALALAGCAVEGKDPREWCHERGGYVANTGWYEWSCVIGDKVLPLPSPGEVP